MEVYLTVLGLIRYNKTMVIKINHAGKRYGKLEVLSQATQTGVHPKWNCLCDCGKKSIVTSTKLVSGSTKSCGCLRVNAQDFRKSEVKTIYPKEHSIWKNMRQRCLNPNTHKYFIYGGRGITIDSSWNSFRNFIEDMGNRPSLKHSLGRIDNNKGYSKVNCRWETSEQQMNNTSRNVFLDFKNQRKTVSQWEKFLGFAHGTVKSRIYRGWSIEKSLTTHASAV